MLNMQVSEIIGYLSLVVKHLHPTKPLAIESIEGSDRLIKSVNYWGIQLFEDFE